MNIPEGTTRTSTQDKVAAILKFSERSGSTSSTVSKPSSPFLALPSELRCLIYSFLSPSFCSDSKEFGKPKHLCLIQTCRQIRDEAPPEIQKVVGSFYRDYERKWYEKQGERIRIENQGEWGTVSVKLSKFPERTIFPLIELPIRKVVIDDPLVKDNKAARTCLRVTAKMTPKAKVRCLKVIVCHKLKCGSVEIQKLDYRTYGQGRSTFTVWLMPGTKRKKAQNLGSLESSSVAKSGRGLGVLVGREFW